MRDPNRTPMMIAALENVWKKYPDLRLGQLISVVATRHMKTTDRTGTYNFDKIFNIEDDKFLKQLMEFRQEIMLCQEAEEKKK